MAARSVYRGSVGASRKELIHVTCTCGAIAAAEVYVSVDVSAHGELGERMRACEDGHTINQIACSECGTALPVHIPILYHDPEREALVLVVPIAQRHRELAVRIDVLQALERDPAPVPVYAKEFAVVFGGSGLRTYLLERDDALARAGVDARREKDLQRTMSKLDSDRADLSARASELELLRGELGRQESELGRRLEEMARLEQELTRQLQESERRSRDLEQKAHALEQRALDLRTAQETRERVGFDTEPLKVMKGQRQPSTDKTVVVPFAHSREAGRPAQAANVAPANVAPASVAPSAPEQSLRLFGSGGSGDDDTALTAPVVRPLIKPSSDSAEKTLSEADQGETELDVTEAVEIVEGDVVTTDISFNVNEIPESAIKPWIDSGESACVFVDAGGAPRVCIVVEHAEKDMMLRPTLDLRLQLHKLPSFPLIAMALGTPGALRGQTVTPPVSALMSIEDDSQRRALTLLARSFTFHLDVYNQRYTLLRRRRITGNLEDNAQHVLDQAASHLASITAGKRSLKVAIGQWVRNDYDRFGWRHSERSEFREDKLTDLSTAQTVRRALAIANRFSKPDRGEYLFNLRGYPLRLWTRQRRAVLARAVEFGIWMGQRLAPLAIREGLARSHDELIGLLQNNFTRFRATASPANDLDEDAASDNWAALNAQASSLENTGTTRATSAESTVVRQRKGPRSSPIASSSAAEVSGTIGSNPRVRLSARAPRNMSVEELLDGLGDAKLAVESAVELARRRETRAIEKVMASIMQMNRLDAVRALSAVPSYGDPVTRWLTDGLAHNKGFIRQGCALALSVLRNEEALEAVSDQVIIEPTPIWKEMARGIGTVGPSAIMPLVSRLSKNDEGARERVAWALAHIAARGGRRQVNQLSQGRNQLAASVARHALELENHVKREDLQVRGRNTPKEHTVNRAFSRRFFQALEASAPVVDALAAVDPASEMSSPAMLLDEADLLEASEYDAQYDEDAAELLDESDLIPT